MSKKVKLYSVFRYLFLTSFSASPGSRSNQSLGFIHSKHCSNVIFGFYFQYSAIIHLESPIEDKSYGNYCTVLDPLTISVFITELLKPSVQFSTHTHYHVPILFTNASKTLAVVKSAQMVSIMKTICPVTLQLLCTKWTLATTTSYTFNYYISCFVN